MNRLVTKFAGLLILVLLVTVATTTTSCNKNKQCKAVITVLAPGGNPMAGATIDLKSGDVTLTSATDGSGTANFETELPMILDIYVNGTPTGRVARLEEGKTDNVTVQM
ncbi:MAG TPA: hypothetical protein VK826_07975 [Bacteroidia bacterium]|nr:hypothetical protein [Bacteroidia bacterium]